MFKKRQIQGGKKENKRSKHIYTVDKRQKVPFQVTYSCCAFEIQYTMNSQH